MEFDFDLVARLRAVATERPHNYERFCRSNNVPKPAAAYVAVEFPALPMWTKMYWTYRLLSLGVVRTAVRRNPRQRLCADPFNDSEFYPLAVGKYSIWPGVGFADVPAAYRTEALFIECVRYRPRSLVYIPRQHRSFAVCQPALAAGFLSHVPPQFVRVEDCVVCALKYPNRFDLVPREFRHHPSVLALVKKRHLKSIKLCERTPQLYRAVLRNDISSFLFVPAPLQTPQGAVAFITHSHGCGLTAVAPHLLSLELCTLAVRLNRRVLRHVPPALRAQVRALALRF
jgi:hypothetical protein